MINYKTAQESGNLASNCNKNLVNATSELKNHWKGRAATEFFSVQDELIKETDIIKEQTSLLLVVVSLAKKIEKINIEIEQLEAQIANADEDEPVALLQIKLSKLKKEKKELIAKASSYLSDIVKEKIKTETKLVLTTENPKLEFEQSFNELEEYLDNQNIFLAFAFALCYSVKDET